MNNFPGEGNRVRDALNENFNTQITEPVRGLPLTVGNLLRGKGRWGEISNIWKRSKQAFLERRVCELEFILQILLNHVYM
jgi:hypothetical protein